ncbi:MAG: hypothetical protein EOP54_15030, partial [Sphingobacteriales bacterium]
MSTILHILNGDATLPSFEQTGLDGDAFIWREMLSEGPLTENISSAAFWEAREAWISKTFQVPPENYRQDMVDQLGKLNEPYEEFNLWFDFDLHCQVNLLGAMKLLQQKVDMSAPAVYLICPAEYPDKFDFAGMGELNGDELDYLYDTIRVQLTEYDFSLAAEAWKAYISNKAEAIQKFIDGTQFWANLSLLKPALEAHIKRLQQNAAGLNYIEQKLLNIYTAGTTTKPGIYTAFWQTEKIYGMGDTQLDLLCIAHAVYFFGLPEG